MKNHNIRVFFDYIPFIILCISAFVLIRTIYTSDILLVWKHYIGLILLPMVAFMFYKKHRFGVLSLGFTLLLGLIGIISFSPTITIYTFGFSWSVNIIRFQPIFLLWLVIHFILSGRYYIGILSKEYWLNLSERK